MSKFLSSSFLTVLLILCSTRCSGKIRDQIFNGQCFTEEFQCKNNACVSKGQHCNKINDCGDNSDEEYCSGQSTCPTFYPFFKCSYSNNYYGNNYRCIPSIWKCDGFRDCYNGEDEQNCVQPEKDDIQLSPQQVNLSRRRAIDWINGRAQKDSLTDRWGPHVQKTAVAFHLASSRLTSNDTKKEMAYELSIQLLTMFARKKGDVNLEHTAPYINALIVSCINPRKFHSFDLVKELRDRVDAQNYTNPYDLLTLCNAGEKLTQKDIDKLIYAFKNPHHQVWTETQAIAVMALVCAGQQPSSSFSLNSLKDLTAVLKQKQFRNGTVENAKTTALVMQALFASEPEEDEDNFDDEKAMLQILRSQQADGSFGSLVDTYYVLPVLSYRSLVNISDSHCSSHQKDEETALKDLINQRDPRIRVRYTLWIGDAKDVERSLKLRVPKLSSFYDVMEIARDIDHKYSFQYIVRDTKPYITAISGLSDDPETGKFWFPFFFNGTKPSYLESSPVDLVLKDNDHVALWYRSGQWIQ